jgi:cardiolipin synthase
MHRKLCVVDQRVLFCGGINLQDDYFELSYGKQDSPRLDYAVRVEGPLVTEGQHTVQQFWRRLMATKQVKHGHFAEAQVLVSPATQAARGSPASATSLNAAPSKNATASPEAPGDARAALVLRDNVRNRRTIERAYRLAIAHARSEVVIANAYFLPGAQLRRALVHAARRGVRVQLLLQGRYEYFMQFHAAKPFYASLLAAGVEIYEYHAAYLHAKVAVVDKHWATVGSSNLDPLSLLLAREANVVVEDGDFALLLHSSLADAIANRSIEIEARAFANRPLLQRAKDWIAYGVMRATLFLTGRDY